MFYFGEIAALTAALLWSIAVIIFKTLSTKISPLLITGLKNLIALICFVILSFINYITCDQYHHRLSYIYKRIS